MKLFRGIFFLIQFLIIGAFFSPAALLKADPALPLSGGDMYNNARVGLGDYAGAQGAISVPCYADGAITKGDVVVISTTTTYPVMVKTTTTPGDPKAFGIALNTAADTVAVNVAIYGVVRARVAVSSTIGGKYVTSGTAGKLTGVAAVTETLFTAVSGSAQVFTALETKTITGGDGFVIGVVHGR